MSLESTVLGLTQATETLLQSVNTRKLDLDAAQTTATTAASSAALSAAVSTAKAAEATTAATTATNAAVTVAVQATAVTATSTTVANNAALASTAATTSANYAQAAQDSAVSATTNAGIASAAATALARSIINPDSPPVFGSVGPAAATFTALTSTDRASFGTGAVRYLIANGSSDSANLGVNAGPLSLYGGYTQGISFYTNSYLQQQLNISHTPNAVNYVQATGGASGNGATIFAQGSDATVNLNLIPKGTGVIKSSGTGIQLAGSVNGFVGLKAAAIAGSTTYTLPGTDGIFGQILTTSGTGNLSWATVSVPTLTSQLTNDSGFLTSAPTLTSQLTNDSGFLTSVPNLDASKITSGIIDAARLPSYVDDVLEYANLAGFPATGETGKIYVALDTNKAYRWSGSTYVYITSGAVDSVAGKTGVVSLTGSDVGLGSVENKSSVTIRGELTSSNVTTALGFTPYSSTNPNGYTASGLTVGNTATTVLVQATGATPEENGTLLLAAYAAAIAKRVTTTSTSAAQSVYINFGYANIIYFDAFYSALVPLNIPLYVWPGTVVGFLVSGTITYARVAHYGNRFQIENFGSIDSSGNYSGNQELNGTFSLQVTSSTTTPSDLYIGPGNYTCTFNINEPYVNIHGLTNADDIIISNITVNADNVNIRNITGSTNFDCGLNSYYILNCKGAFNSTNGFKGTFENCTGGDNSFIGKFNYATFINCRGGSSSFTATSTTPLNGNFSNCTGGGGSFNSYTTDISGVFTNCTSNGGFNTSSASLSGTFENCSGSFNALNISGTFKNCTGTSYSFGYSGGGTCSGVFIKCTGGQNSFYIPAGLFIDCAALSGSFGNGYSADISGKLINCTAGYNGFSASISGTLINCTAAPTSGSGQSFAVKYNGSNYISGVLINCTCDGDYGFGSNGGASGGSPYISGKLVNCHLLGTNGLAARQGGGKLINCTKNYVLIND